MYILIILIIILLLNRSTYNASNVNGVWFLTLDDALENKSKDPFEIQNK